MMDVCDDCGEEKPDVCYRACVYYDELYDDEYMELVCDDCEYEHAMDIQS